MRRTSWAGLLPRCGPIRRGESLVGLPHGGFRDPSPERKTPRSTLKKLLLILFLVPAALPAADFDLLIKGARVVDGTGNPWYRADVGVLDGKIAAVGSLSQLSATRVVEAGELVLAPGFIDVHTHVEDEVENFPDGANFLRDGVTTIVTGNCGGSKTDLVAFFSRLEKLGLGPNLASLIGHNSVRRKVMGNENRPAEAAEITKMQELVDTAMRDGAVGLSTGLIYVPLGWLQAMLFQPTHPPDATYKMQDADGETADNADGRR